MRGETAPARLLMAASLAAWTVVIGLPIVFFFVQVIHPAAESETSGEIFVSAMRSFGLAVLIAAAAVIVGWVPGRLLGTSRTGGDILLLLLLLRIARLMTVIVLSACMVHLTGCDGKPYSSDGPQVVDTFGRTGRGQGEFVYPRAIDMADDGCLFIVDKTGRIQRLSSKGDFLGCFQMPLVETGKPTGLCVAPNGNLFVADTHYHRVVVFSPQGEILHAFGSFGQDKGCFIYPTDVAFSQDGRVFVGEYGGNDRISVFDEQGEFLYCFGSPGSGEGQLARPAALCVDKVRECLYVADACNHRIAIYKLDGTLLGYIGSAGREQGQLRYPYDLALLPNGTLVVCEYGNNRLQLFDSQGNSLAVYGGPGRQLGQLAYPWGVAVDSDRRAFVVDAGNNRIQVWQL